MNSHKFFIGLSERIKRMNSRIDNNYHVATVQRLKYNLKGKEPQQLIKKSSTCPSYTHQPIRLRPNHIRLLFTITHG